MNGFCLFHIFKLFENKGKFNFKIRLKMFNKLAILINPVKLLGHKKLSLSKRLEVIGRRTCIAQIYNSILNKNTLILDLKI